jgi:hypothetical protein
MSSPQLDSWLHRVVSLKCQLSQLTLEARELANIPQVGSAEERVGSFLELWGLLGIPSPAENSAPAKVLSDQITSYLEPNSVLTVSQAFRDLAFNLDAAIGTSARASTFTNPAIVRSADFDGGRGVRFITTAQAHLPMAYALLESLPGDHFLRQRIQAQDCIQQSEGATLKLGMAGGSLSAPVARAWYPTDSILRLTRAVREAQRREEAEKRADEERKRAAEEDRRRHDPLAPLRKAQEQAAWMASLNGNRG